MARLSMAWAALLGLAACGGVPSDVSEPMDLQTQQSFEARRAALLREPAPMAASDLAADDRDLALRAAAAIDEAEAETGGAGSAAPARPAAPVPGVTPTTLPSGTAAPAGRGLPALPPEDDALALPSGSAAVPADDSAPGCAQFATAGAAQNWFIANGGPAIDPDGLDPDGDGRVCGWTPPATGG